MRWPNAYAMHTYMCVISFTYIYMCVITYIYVRDQFQYLCVVHIINAMHASTQRRNGSVVNSSGLTRVLR